MKALQASFESLPQSRAARGLAVVGGSALTMGSAHAATYNIDTTDIVAVITGGVTTISSIGIAVLSLVVVIKLFKWAQRIL